MVHYPPQPINYSDLFPGFGSGGKGISVGILDNGFFDHEAFGNGVSIIRDFSVDNGSCEDLHGHGTHIAGIIGARFQDSSLPVLGIAPECDLIIGKIIPDIGGTNDSAFIVEGIKWAMQQGIKVLNLSLAVDAKNIPQLEPIITSAYEQNIIIVAAAGDVKELDDQTVQYPASDFEHCISVAEISNTYLNTNPDINPGINFLTGYSNYLSTSIALHDYYESLRGSSIGCAFITGLVVRILSQWKETGKDIDSVKKEEIINELNKIAVLKNSLNFTDFSPFKIAKP
jgi:subtilisin family serine protease